MPTVKMPDGSMVELPDNPTEEQRAFLRTLVPSAAAQLPPRTTEEAFKHYGTEAAKIGGTAVYGAATAFPRLWNMGGKAIEAMIPGEVDPKFQEFKDAGDAQVTGLDNKIRTALMPTSSEAQTAARVGEATVGAFMGPGGFAAPLKTALIGGGSGVGAEIAADALGDNAVSRMIGGLAGGGLTGLATNPLTNRGALSREVLADVRPEDLEIARARMIAAEMEGRPITLAQAMPRASNIDTAVDTLANSRQGVRTTNILRNQPQVVAFGAEEAVQRLPGTVISRQQAANQAQEVMSDLISTGIDNAGKAWRAIAPQNAAFSEHSMHVLANKLAGMANLYPGTARAAMLDAVRKNLLAQVDEVDNAPEILNMFGKPLRDKPVQPKYLTDALQVKGAIDSILENFGSQNNISTSGERILNRQAQEVRALFKDMIDLEAPQLAAANEAFSTHLSQIVDPMKKSVIGRISGRKGAQDGAEAATSKLFTVFDQGTLPGTSSSEILTLERAYRQAGDPEGFQDAVKSWMVARLDKALKSPDNREPTNIAETLRGLFGNPRMADSASKGMEDMLVGLARSQGIKDEDHYLKGFRQFMEYVSDVARRPSSVSGLSAAGMRDVAGQGALNRLGRFSIMTPVRQPILAWSTFLENDALKAMDELLTSSSGIDTLIKLGKAQPYSQSALTAMATFLGTNASIQSAANPPELP